MSQKVRRLNPLTEARTRALLRVIELRGVLYLDPATYKLIRDLTGLTRAQADRAMNRLVEAGKAALRVDDRTCSISVCTGVGDVE